MTPAELNALAASLTPKQRAFANAIAEGLDGVAAYRLSYAARSSPEILKVRAHEVRHHPRVSQYIAALIAKHEQGRYLSRQRKRELLATMAEDRAAARRDRIAAIALDNRMTGDEQPVLVEHSGSVSVSIVEAVRRQRMASQAKTNAG